MKRVEATSYPVSIFVAGDYAAALTICRGYCDQIGLCVTVTPTTYVYTGGEEAGVVVGLINYPRFPSSSYEIFANAEALALRLIDELGQQSASIQAPDRTVWISFRNEDEPSRSKAGRGRK